MPTAPQTWAVLQAIQYRIWNEVKVGGVSPFSTFSAADQTAFGTNPEGTVTTAVYIGVPKDWDVSEYPKQCHIIPPMQENVYWRGLGGKVWDEQSIYVRVCVSRHDNWYQAQQDIINARDAMYTVFSKHAELPFTPIVRATKAMQPRQIPAYHHDQAIGVDWDCWGFLLWLNQEWFVSAGVQA